MSARTGLDLRAELHKKTRDDLHIIARRLSVRGYRRLNKSELVDAILTKGDRSTIARHLSVTWWDRNNALLGISLTIVGLILTVGFWLSDSDSEPDGPDASLGDERSDDRHREDTPDRESENADDESEKSENSKEPANHSPRTPRSYIPDTLLQVTAVVRGKDLTMLQLEELRSKYVGKSIEWKGIIQAVTLAGGFDEDPSIFAIVSPIAEGRESITWVPVVFLATQRKVLEKLKRGDEVTFTGLIEDIVGITNLPKVKDAEVVRYSVK